MGFVERLREFVGREARLEKVQVSNSGPQHLLARIHPGLLHGGSGDTQGRVGGGCAC